MHRGLEGEETVRYKGSLDSLDTASELAKFMQSSSRALFAALHEVNRAHYYVVARKGLLLAWFKTGADFVGTPTDVGSALMLAVAMRDVALKHPDIAVVYLDGGLLEDYALDRFLGPEPRQHEPCLLYFEGDQGPRPGWMPQVLYKEGKRVVRPARERQPIRSDNVAGASAGESKRFTLPLLSLEKEAPSGADIEAFLTSAAERKIQPDDFEADQLLLADVLMLTGTKKAVEYVEFIPNLVSYGGIPEA